MCLCGVAGEKIEWRVNKAVSQCGDELFKRSMA
jgi:hypothetical protein